MKKILPIIILLFASNFLVAKLHSQCSVSDLAIELKTAVPVAQGCEVVFNFSWVQEVNAGNKFAYVHLWPEEKYPALQANNLAYYPTSNCPTSEDLTDVLATIVIEQNGSAHPLIGTVYHPQSAVAVLSNGVTVVKENINSTSERMTIQNITLIISNCSGSGITGDIWASQAENGGNVHCVSSNVNFVVGNPRVTGLLFCDVPRQYSVQIKNIGHTSITSSYNVYIDEGDGVYEPAQHDPKITASAVGPVIINPDEIYSSGIQSYLPYSAQWPYYNNGLWIEVTTVGIPNKTLYYVDNTCIALPVALTSFSARRDGSTVLLKWETSNESGNAGFEVQRKIGNGEFTTIGFVPSKAVFGNSNSLLTYDHRDINHETGISQYRLKQIDLNGDHKYSDTRIVNGEGQKRNFIIYPNPSTDGEMNVLFEETVNHHTLSLIDMKGRLVRKWSSITLPRVRLGNIAPGIYSLIVTDQKSGEAQSTKVVVMNRR